MRFVHKSFGDITSRRCFTIKQELPINEQIKAREVQVIDENGQKLGKLSLNEALDMAFEKKLDLVLVAPNVEPPVCKIMNYGKYKFEQAKKEKEAKKKQHTVDVKEIKIRYKIDVHDYQVRINNIKKFISQGNKVKVIVMLRGREMQHSKLAFDLANRFVEDLKNEPMAIEKKPQMEGRNVTLLIGPQVDKK